MKISSHHLFHHVSRDRWQNYVGMEIKEAGFGSVLSEISEHVSGSWKKKCALFLKR